MKKTILGVVIFAIAIIMMIGSVNAASITPSNTEVELKKGQTVRITVSVEPTSAIQFDLKYNKTKFKFITASAGILGDNAGEDHTGEGNTNYVSVAAFALNGTDKTETATVDFEVLETAELGKSEFTIEGLVTESMEQVAEPTKEVTIVKAKEEVPPTPDQPENPDQPANPDESTNPTTPEQPTNPTTPEQPSTDNQANGGKVGTDGNVIKELPDTGAPMYVIAVAIIIVAVATLGIVIKKHN